MSVSSLRQLVEWYIPEDEYVINIKDEYITFARIPTDYFKKTKTNKLMIGFTEGLFVVAPTQDERGLSLAYHTNGTSLVHVPAHLREWLYRKGLTGKFEAEINNTHHWVQTRKRIEE